MNIMYGVVIMKRTLKKYFEFVASFSEYIQDKNIIVKFWRVVEKYSKYIIIDKCLWRLYNPWNNIE